MASTADPRLVTWGELDPRTVWSDDPLLNPEGVTSETVVTLGREGHPLYRFDEAKTLRMIERCRELGGDSFIFSKDLGYMQCTRETCVTEVFGWRIRTDEGLPDNTVMLWAGD